MKEGFSLLGASSESLLPSLTLRQQADLATSHLVASQPLHWSLISKAQKHKLTEPFQFIMCKSNGPSPVQEGFRELVNGVLIFFFSFCRMSNDLEFGGSLIFFFSFFLTLQGKCIAHIPTVKFHSSILQNPNRKHFPSLLKLHRIAPKSYRGRQRRNRESNCQPRCCLTDSLMLQ